MAKATQPTLSAYLEFCVKLASACSVYSAYIVKRLLASLADIEQLAHSFLSTCEEEAQADACLAHKTAMQVRCAERRGGVDSSCSASRWRRRPWSLKAVTLDTPPPPPPRSALFLTLRSSTIPGGNPAGAGANLRAGAHAAQ